MKNVLYFFTKFKDSILQNDKKIVIKNYFSLSLLNIFSYIFPLITVPYLVRIIGVEKFGLISFAQSLMQYFIVFINYGFNFTATQKISLAKAKNNNNKVFQTFNAVYMSQLVLLAVSFFILFVLVVFVPIFKQDAFLYFFSFGIVINAFLLPIWFFQGIQEMQYITVMQIVSRIFFTFFIFIFIREQSHYLRIPIINSISGVIAGGATLIVLKKKYKVDFYLPSFKEVKTEFHDGKHLFLSRAAITLYTASNILILGLLTNNTIVGYYAGAEKIVNVAKNITGPITLALFPFINQRIAQSKKLAIKTVKKIAPLVVGFTGFISLGVFVFAGFAVNIILGDAFERSIPVLRWLAFTPLIISTLSLIGTQILIPFGYKRQISAVTFSAGILNLLLLFTLIPPFQERGVAISSFVIESYVLIVYLILLKKNKIKVFEK